MGDPNDPAVLHLINRAEMQIDRYPAGLAGRGLMDQSHDAVPRAFDPSLDLDGPPLEVLGPGPHELDEFVAPAIALRTGEPTERNPFAVRTHFFGIEGCAGVAVSHSGL